MKKTILFVSSFLLLVSGAVLCAEQQANQSSSSLYPQLAQLYLPSSNARTAVQCKEEKQRRVAQQKAMKALEKKIKEQYRGGGKEVDKIAQVQFILQYPQARTSLLEPELFECAYEMFEQADIAESKANMGADKALFDDRLRVMKDLSIFSGADQDETNNVFDKLNRTQTVFGAVTLQHDLLDVNKSQLQIRQQQDVVKTLLRRPELMEKIDSFLLQIKNKQQGLLEAWNVVDHKKQNLQDLLYPSSSDYVNSPSMEPWAAKIEKKLLESPLSLECRSWAGRLVQFLVASIGGLEGKGSYEGLVGIVKHVLPPSLVGIAWILLNDIWKITAAPLVWGALLALLCVCIYSVFKIPGMIKNMPEKWGAFVKGQEPSVFDALWFTLIDMRYGWSLLGCAAVLVFMVATLIFLRILLGKFAYDSAKAMDRITNWIHATMNDWSAFVKSFEGLKKTIHEEQELRSLMLQEFPALMEKIDPITQQYCDILKQDDIAQAPTFWSKKGHMLWINKALMDGGKDSFVPFFKMVGRIDACMSIAKLMKESGARKTGKFCFVEFADQQAPYIDARDMWHANLDPSKVVSNSVMLDALNGPVGFVVTGPNEGGKTTFIKALATGLILRNWGIFPGTYAKITDFKHIETVMNTRDKAGISSSFQAQLQNVNHVLEIAKKVNEEKDGNYLMLFDESLNATNAEEGGSLSYAVLEYLASLRTGFVISTSHHRQTTDIAKEHPQWFKNLKVEAFPNTDPATKTARPYLYPYTVKEGISDQYIAIDLAQAEGSIGSSIATKARAKLLDFLQSNAVDKNMFARAQIQ